MYYFRFVKLYAHTEFLMSAKNLRRSGWHCTKRISFHKNDYNAVTVNLYHTDTLGWNVIHYNIFTSSTITRF